MATTADIKNGLCIDFNNDIFQIVEFQHVKPGKGGAFVRGKLKSMTTGKVIENTWNSGHKIDIVRVERKVFQYLYSDESSFHFMDNVSYEQIQLPKEMLDNADLIKEGQEVEVLIHAETEKPLMVETPPFVELEVTETVPGEKGNTATNAQKPATVETGAEIMVPLFINEGDKLKIDTRDRSYVERVK
jgi:elongation factor P